MAAPGGVTHKKRLLIMLVSFTLIFAALIVRLGYIQLIWGGRELQEKAAGQVDKGGTCQCIPSGGA